jgi:hypothetical protein
MHTSGRLAGDMSGTASVLQGARRAVGLTGSIEPHVVFGHAGPRDGERPAVLLQDFTARAGIGVGGRVEDEVGAAEGPFGPLALVPDGDMRRDVLSSTIQARISTDP